MSISQDRIVSLTLTSNSRPEEDTEEVENEPIFFLEIRFSYKFEKWRRDFSGDWNLIQSNPVGPPSNYLFKVHPYYKLAQSPTKYDHFIDGFLSDMNFNEPLRSILAKKIGYFLVSLANEERFWGSCSLAEVETTYQKFVDAKEDVITATVAATEDGYLVSADP